VKVRNSRRAAAAIAALVLILCVYRPGVYRLRNRIAGSIGSALGRRVALENVRLHLLPRPGFDLEGLVIYDDPAFSAEPMIRAQEVSAAIRLRSLLRGRLEIATLSATEPSINLVRNSARPLEPDEPDRAQRADSRGSDSQARFGAAAGVSLS
jgi:uncharacterized protein involved in outer membrane biogenesis